MASSTTESYLQLLGLAVHEFRTPASVVGGYLRMLQRDAAGELNDRQRKMIDEAEKSCARLVTLIAEMSDVAKLDSGAIALARQPVDIFALVSDVVVDVQEARDREVRLEVRGEDGAAHVNGDATRLRAAFDAVFRAVLREKAARAWWWPSVGAKPRTAKAPPLSSSAMLPPYRQHTSANAAYSTKSAAEWALRFRSHAASSKDTADESPPRHRFQDPRQDKPPIFWRRIPLHEGPLSLHCP